MKGRTDVVIVGAGPYGLSLAAHLRARGVDFRIFGDPLVFWRRMLPRVRLKSPDFGSNIYTPESGNTFVEWCIARGRSLAEPIPMSQFTEYAVDTQRRLLPMVETTNVRAIRPQHTGFEVTLEDGARFDARRIVVAVGLGYFARIPPALSRLPRDFATHTGDHADYGGWRGREVVVVGAGQSAVEAADELVEQGATVTMVMRAPGVIFTPVPSGGPRRLRHRVRHPRTVMGEGWLSYSLQHIPIWPHLLPDSVRIQLTRRHLGPYATWWLRDVETRATLVTRSTITAARVRDKRIELQVRADGTDERTIIADHVVNGTGYEADIARIPFLPPELAGRVARIAGAPRLTPRFESSVPGLFFIGPLAASSFGPLLRFVCGAEYAAPALARHLARGTRGRDAMAVSSWAG